MPDLRLIGNSYPCPACALRRAALPPASPMDRAPALVECQLCDGFGRLALDPAEIVARDVAWARAHYWPTAFARWAEDNAARIAFARNTGKG